MCGLTKLGTNVVTISSSATVKERNHLCIHNTPILGFTFKVTHWITLYLHIECNHTCDLARVTSKISFGALWLTFSRSHIR